MSSQRTRRLALAAVLLVAGVGHWLYWYAPRERPTALDGRSMSGRVFLDSRLANRVWLPFPHQNLGRLSGTVEDPRQWTAAAARLLGSEVSTLPRFGPFLLPPSRALAVAADPFGERIVVVAEVYPILSLVARLAGRLAGNPFLAGGDVTVDGRPYQVSWRDGAWILHSSAEELILTPSSRRLEPTLGALEHDGSSDVLPAGRYGLRRPGADLVLSIVDQPSPDREQVRRQLADRLDPQVRGALAFLGLRDAGSNDESWLVFLSGDIEELSLPSAAVVYLDADRRWLLPGEILTRRLGLVLQNAERPPRRVVAIDRRSLLAGVQLADAANAGLSTGLSRALWLRPAALLPLIGAVRYVVDEVPLFGTAEVQRWRDLETLLGPLAALAGVSIEVGDAGDWAELRLWSEDPWSGLVTRPGDD